jgi:hypothetical protein
MLTTVGLWRWAVDTLLDKRMDQNNGNMAQVYGANMDILIEQLVHLSADGLFPMFDSEKQLFCYRAKPNGRGFTNEGLSRRYTLIALLGLNRFQAHSGRSPIIVQELLSTLIDCATDIDNIGDLGLLLWLCAEVSPDKAEMIFSKLAVRDALTRYDDALQASTMEMAWFLSGLTHVALSGGRAIAGLEYLASKTLGLLLDNYGCKGIFAHMGKLSISGIVRGRIGSFADQVYPIYALARFSEAFDSMKALEVSLECAATICRLQGPLGQWWWHYDASTGMVIGRYPVYAVHQHGMAPMALYAIGKISGKDFNAWIYKGLRWLTGANELGFNMIDVNRNVIWRSLYANKCMLYIDEALSILGMENDLVHRLSNFKVRYECRPYCLGWLLYAFG